MIALGYHVIEVPTYGCQEIHLILLTSVENGLVMMGN